MSLAGNEKDNSMYHPQLYRANTTMVLRSMYISYIHTRRIRRCGLTPANGYAHARNGRTCREIEATNAKVLPKGASIKSHRCVRLSRKRNRHYILNPTWGLIKYVSIS